MRICLAGHVTRHASSRTALPAGGTGRSNGGTSRLSEKSWPGAVSSRSLSGWHPARGGEVSGVALRGTLTGFVKESWMLPTARRRRHQTAAATSAADEAPMEARPSAIGHMQEPMPATASTRHNLIGGNGHRSAPDGCCHQRCRSATNGGTAFGHRPHGSMWQTIDGSTGTWRRCRPHQGHGRDTWLDPRGVSFHLPERDMIPTSRWPSQTCSRGARM